MPPSNFNNQNTSHFMRLSKAQIIKARRCLIGSIVLLLIAIIVLLNVTARIKPINIKPETIEIRNTASTPVAIHRTASTVLKTIASSTHNDTTNTNVMQQIKTASVPKVQQTTTNKPVASTAVIQGKKRTTTVTTATAVATESTVMHFTPLIMSEGSKVNATPEEILNGTADTLHSTKRYYIQLLVSHDKNKLLHYKQLLAHRGVSAIVQTVTIANGSVLYRLRLGPFANKNQANSAYLKFKRAYP